MNNDSRKVDQNSYECADVDYIGHLKSLTANPNDRISNDTKAALRFLIPFLKREHNRAGYKRKTDAQFRSINIDHFEVFVDQATAEGKAMDLGTYQVLGNGTRSVWD
jgi:hypothetical protein